MVVDRAGGVGAALGATALLLVSVTAADDVIAPLVRPWGSNSLRVTLCAHACDDHLPGALGLSPPTMYGHPPSVRSERAPGMLTGSDSVVSGNIKATMDKGLLVFSRVDDGMLLQVFIHLCLRLYFK